MFKFHMFHVNFIRLLNQSRINNKVNEKNLAVCALSNLRYILTQSKKPAVPTKRAYSVHGNVKISYPQSRCMKTDFPGEEAM